MPSVRALARAAVPGPVRVRARRTWDRATHVGNAVECPLCRRTFRTWLGRADQPWARRCPMCDSFPRHRVLWLWLERRGVRPAQGARVLHLAPEPSILRRLRETPGLRVATLDLHRADVTVRADATGLPFRTASFDAVLCNHVLEHVPDDRAAMAELARVTAPGGWATLLVPVDVGRATTFEDASIVSEAAREHAFGQFDHVRLYGRDYVDRLGDAGWTVETETCRDVFDEDERRRWGLFDGEVLYLARRR